MFLTNFPSQKRPQSKKTKKWYKDCVDAFDVMAVWTDTSQRLSLYEKIINEDLLVGKLHMEDLMSIINPNDLSNIPIPEEIPHYDLLGPRIDVLIGEELKRGFKYKVVAINPETISRKINDKKEELINRLIQIIQTSGDDEKEIEQKLIELEKYAKYNYLDFREIKANKIANYLRIEQQLDQKFSEGFRDAITFSEEIYMIDIVSNEPVVTRLDPKTVFSYRSGNSNKIQDSDIIAIVEYWNPGKVIDTYFRELSSKDIEKIEKGMFNGAGESSLSVPAPEPIWTTDSFSSMLTKEILNFSYTQGFNPGLPFDQNGNVRVLRLFWKGFRPIKEVTSYDPITGEEVKDFYSEDYQIRPELGETEKTYWINEWYEATKIADDIYVNMRPKPVQFRKLSNPSVCYPGIVGRVYTVSGNKPVSIVSKAKNYLYLYNIRMHSLNELLQKNYGKILVMDFAMIPKSWDVTQWFNYLKKMNIAVQDSFKESAKGPAMGKLAGNLGRGGHDYIDLDQAQNIQQHIAVLEYLKNQISYITGITDQRLGNVSQYETVGGIERSVSQSSHITEWWFYQHYLVKLDVMEHLIETAKIAWKNNKKKIQTILDDQSIETFQLDDNDFFESEFGILPLEIRRIAEIEQKLQMAAEQMYANNKLKLSTLIDIYLSPSIAEVKRKLEIAEEEVEKIQQEMQQMELEKINEQIEFEREVKLSELELKKYEIDRKYDNEILKLTSDNKKFEMEINSKTGETDSPYEHEEYNYKKLELEKEKEENRKKQAEAEFEEKKRQFNEKIKLEKEKIKALKRKPKQ